MPETVNILIPVRLPDWWRELAIERYAKHTSKETDVVGIDLTPEQQEQLTDDRLPGFLLENARVQEAVRADAHIIDCFSDPGLALLSQELTGPVVGVGQAGLWFAHGRFHRFAVITSERGSAERIRGNAARSSLDHRLEDVLSIDIPAGEIPGASDRAFNAVAELAQGLSDRVDGLVLGCTELVEFTPRLETRLAGGRKARIRVVNPIAVAIRLAELRILLERARS